MHILLYFCIIIICLILTFIIGLLINNKYKIICLEKYIYSYIIFLVFFVLCSKIGNIIIDLNFNNFYHIFKFLITGYTFIGGYIGCLISIKLLSIIFKLDKYKIMLLFIPNMLLMYAILKIGCYINNCCIGYIDFPIQLLESIINLIAYFIIIFLIFKNKSKNKIIGYSIILFGLIRFVLSNFRVYNSTYSFIFVEIICLFLIIYGYYINRKVIR